MSIPTTPNSSQLTQAQLDEIKEVFDLFDADGNSSLSREEVANAMNYLIIFTLRAKRRTAVRLYLCAFA